MRLATRLAVAIALILGGCSSKEELPGPPPSTTTPQFQSRSSTIVAPISIDLDEIQRALEKEVPRQLWTIDRREQKCIPGERLKVLGADIKVTPDIDCRIVGEVDRGAISLSGSGQRLRIALPIDATISARDIGGILKGETATASAVLYADVKLGLDRNWNPNATVQLAYDWKEPPGIDFLGQRISFASKADAKLKGVIDALEKTVQKEIARTSVRPAVERLWDKGFAVIELSKRNPPAWLRVTPQGMGLSGYSVSGREVTLNVEVRALTETFVGDRPPAPEPVPLGPQMPPVKNDGLTFFMPVMADYAQLEPVVLKALRKLAAKGIVVDGVGEVNASFDTVKVYATGDNLIAVGVEARAEPVGKRTGFDFGEYSGRVWLTGRPITEPNSQIVRFTDLNLYGDTDTISGNLVIRVAQTDVVRAAIAEALTQNFDKDYDKLLDKVQKSLASKQEGRIHLSVQVDEVLHDSVQVTGAGLFMPMVVKGRGQVTID